MKTPPRDVHVTTGVKNVTPLARDEEPFPGIPTCNPVTLQIGYPGYNNSQLKFVNSCTSLSCRDFRATTQQKEVKTSFCSVLP